jgi:hypothetical protein
MGPGEAGGAAAAVRGLNCSCQFVKFQVRVSLAPSFFEDDDGRAGTHGTASKSKHFFGKNVVITKQG